MHKVVARVILIKENRILLVKASSDYWFLPGGHLEVGENLRGAASREVYEETGIKCEVKDIAYVSEFFDRKVNSHKIEVFFYAEAENSNLNKNWQDLGEDASILEVKWLDLEELKNIDLRPSFIKGIATQQSKTVNVYQGYEESE